MTNGSQQHCNFRSRIESWTDSLLMTHSWQGWLINQWSLVGWWMYPVGWLLATSKLYALVAGWSILCTALHYHPFGLYKRTYLQHLYRRIHIISYHISYPQTKYIFLSCLAFICFFKYAHIYHIIHVLH